MRVVLQRVNHASVSVRNELISSIHQGFLLLVGFTEGDKQEQIESIVDKIIKLRVFSDSSGKMNLSLKDVNGEVLLVSQFTLYGDVWDGNRPSFTKALGFQEASLLYQSMISYFEKKFGKTVQTGIFGEDMQITLENDGPVTILLEK